MNYILILVFIWDGDIKMVHYGYASLMMCERKIISFTAEAIEQRRPLLIAKCKPIDEAWGI